MKANVKKILFDTLYLTIGCFITAFAVNYILKPNGLITSGITGLAILLEKYLQINYISLLYCYIYNIDYHIYIVG